MDTVHDYAATIFLYCIYPSTAAALINSYWNYVFILPQFLWILSTNFPNGMRIFSAVAVQMSAIFFVPYLFHSWIN